MGSSGAMAAVARERYKSGLYYGPVGVTATTAPGNNSLRVAPFLVFQATSFDRIGVEITSAGEAGSKFRPVVYLMNAAGYPTALLLDAGQLAADAIANPEATISLTLQPGIYAVGGVVQSAPVTPPTVRAMSTSFVPPPVGVTSVANLFAGYGQGGVSGGPPDPMSASVSNASPPRVQLRVV